MLEEILQTYFKCDMPFNENGDLTHEGIKAYNNLVFLLHDLVAIGLIPKERYEDKLDAILNSNN